MNKVMLIGHIGADPEARRFDGGSVVNLRLATTEYYKGRDGNRAERTEWHNVVLWNRLAEIAEKYLRKGSAVLVEGRIRSREFTDKNNVQHRTYDIVATSLMMLDRRPDTGEAADVQGQVSESEVPDDLPF